MGNGRFFFAHPPGLDIKGRLDPLQIGMLGIKAEFSGGAWTLEVVTEEGIDHSSLRDLLLTEETERASPFLKGLALSGRSSLNLKASVAGQGEWQVQGRWSATLPVIALPGAGITISDLAIDIPIDLADAKGLPAASDGGAEGAICVGGVSWNGKAHQGLCIHPLFFRNGFRIAEAIPIDLWGGRIEVRGIQADDITSPGRAFHAAIGLKGLDLKEITGASGFSLSGELEGEIPSLRYKADRLDFAGTLEARALGGAVRAQDLYVERPLSQGRRLGGDISWKGISLDKLTEKIPIGRISGVIEGSLTGFAIEYGQPAAFTLEVRSIKTKGVKQKISVDAINNLSLIGTGSSGVGMVLNSGLNRFFSYYPYAGIGFRCTLENDVFSLRGLIHQGGREYIIRKAFLRGIDMVNQNPDNTINFKDMKERINRIFEERGSAVKAQ